MADEDNIQLNLVNYGLPLNLNPAKRRSKFTKRERLDLKRKRSWLASKAESASSEVKVQRTSHTEETSSGNDKPDQIADSRPKKGSRSKGSQHQKQTASKFSALFTKNPDIPYVQSSHVQSFGETVFTGEGFKDLCLHTFMVSNLEEKMGFTKMTSVQKATIPYVLDGRDVLVKSQTGSGKTLAYAVPVVEKLRAISPKIQRSDGVHAIVLVPTRELAIQSCDTFTKLTRPFTWVVPGALMGGEKRKAEKARLRKGLNIVIATPGRLLDHLQNTHTFSLDKLSWLIIDEADRLLDLGFEKEVAKIVKILDERAPPKRQNLLVSATLSPGVEQLAGMSLNNPLRVDVTNDSTDMNPAQVGIEGKQKLTNLPETISQMRDRTESTDKFATPSSLSHYCVVVPSKLRLVTLASFLLEKCKFNRRPSKIVVFFATQDLVEFHHHLFNTCLKEEDADDQDEEEDEWLFKLHGEMAQKDRTKVFQDFQEIGSGVLLCTDVAARGLDLPQVEWIVQFNPPSSSADYIHRSGRTARAGSHGQALLFLTPAEVDYVKVINDKNISLEMLDMNNLLKFLRGNVIQLLGGTLTGGEVPRTVAESAIALQRKMETYVDSEEDARTLARKAYQSFVRAYTTYPLSMRHIFQMKNLHLGHVAKSFCLAEAPTKIGAVVGTQLGKAKKQNKKKRSNLFNDEDDDQPSAKRQKRKNISEFDSGFDGAVLTGMVRKQKKKKMKTKLKK